MHRSLSGVLGIAVCLAALSASADVAPDPNWNRPPRPIPRPVPRPTPPPPPEPPPPPSTPCKVSSVRQPGEECVSCLDLGLSLALCGEQLRSEGYAWKCTDGSGTARDEVWCRSLAAVRPSLDAEAATPEAGPADGAAEREAEVRGADAGVAPAAEAAGWNNAGAAQAEATAAAKDLPPAGDKPSSGCGSCAVPSGSPGSALLLLGLLAAVWAGRRRLGR